jgi:hypothetical protein
MASASALLVGMPAVRALLAADSTFMSRIGARLYPNSSGDRPQTAAYPYAQVESSSELPLNTMGDPAGLKWGSFARIQIRLGSQWRSEAQVTQLVDDVKRILDGQPITLSGYGSAGLTFETLVKLDDSEAGVVTREWIVEFELTAHQGA